MFIFRPARYLIASRNPALIINFTIRSGDQILFRSHHVYLLSQSYRDV